MKLKWHGPIETSLGWMWRFVWMASAVNAGYQLQRQWRWVDGLCCCFFLGLALVSAWLDVHVDRKRLREWDAIHLRHMMELSTLGNERLKTLVHGALERQN